MRNQKQLTTQKKICHISNNYANVAPNHTPIQILARSSNNDIIVLVIVELYLLLLIDIEYITKTEGNTNL